MSYRAIYAYPWDLAEAGVPEAVAEFRGLGLDTVTVAGSYHAGKFLRPHGSGGKVHFPEDGSVYFRPDPSAYGEIRPVANCMVEGGDVLGELVASGIQVNVWLVLLHNTRLGMAHPNAVCRNAFGDPYPYSLCPSAPEARRYAIALAKDVTDHYAVGGITLETPGFLPYVHGFHHEFAMVRSNAWLENLLGLCFCPHCMADAERAGIDAGRLRARVAGDIEAYLDGDVDFPDDMAVAFWIADVQTDGDLRRFLDFRSAVVTALVSEIRASVRSDARVALLPSVARPTAGAWYEGTDLRAVAAAGIVLEACFYEPRAERVKADLFDVRRRLGARAPLRGVLRPAYPDLASRGEFVAAVAALRAGGVEEIGFYNWGHLRRANLSWIGEALNG